MNDVTYWNLFLRIKKKYPEWSDAQVGVVVHKTLQKNFKAKILNYIKDRYPKDINCDWKGGYAYALDDVKNMVKHERDLKGE